MNDSTTIITIASVAGTAAGAALAAYKNKTKKDDAKKARDSFRAPKSANADLSFYAVDSIHNIVREIKTEMRELEIQRDALIKVFEVCEQLYAQIGKQHKLVIYLLQKILTEVKKKEEKNDKSN